MSMSTSKLFLVKDDKEVELKMLGTPTLSLEDQECLHAMALDMPELHHQKEQEKGHEMKRELHSEVKVPSEVCERVSLGETMVEEDDDGFRTPTSVDHKIPVVTKCPPAPKLRRTMSLKRKEYSTANISRGLELLNLSADEIESLFPYHFLVDLHRMIKKARRGH
ncbi:hypothetical protein CJ030_MR2G023209 [Morella rubra]|uniref:Uncharacterized protein n=1 Tax=Morella rubra TaxID=262757 RepID=A0A6A1WFL2_9ROSI|nr:hypothetical protein CJ030_MR2G023209 [Morella rubra]